MALLVSLFLLALAWTDDDVEGTFSRFEARFGRNYRTIEERAARKAAFAENMRIQAFLQRGSALARLSFVYRCMSLLG